MDEQSAANCLISLNSVSLKSKSNIGLDRNLTRLLKDQIESILTETKADPHVIALIVRQSGLLGLKSRFIGSKAGGPPGIGEIFSLGLHGLIYANQG